MIRWIAAAALVGMALLTAAASPAKAPRQFAILIGVNDYDNLPPERDLLGPGNDVALFRDLLIERGFDKRRIEILSDSIRGAGAPTRKRILQSWQDMAERVEPGDSLFLYFAGHGSQQPTTDATEPDGLEEIILPQDVGRWDGTAGTVENAITDNEIAAFVERLSAKGVDVWAVFDACHSETLTRASRATGERQRYVPPVTDLGIPRTRGGRRAPRTEKPVVELAAGQGAGRVTAFFAATSTEPTPELRLPRGHEDRRYHGLFSFSLAQAIRSQRNATYRDLANALLLDYTAQGRRAPTPRFQGPLDAFPFVAAGDRIEGWPARLQADGRTYDIAAGAAHGLTAGAMLALSTTDGTRTRILLEVTAAGFDRSRAEVSGGGEMLPPAGLAVLDATELELSLAVCAQDAAAESALTATLARSTKLARGGDAGCDVRLESRGDTLWLADTATDPFATADPSRQFPSVAADDGDALLAMLERAARARSLMMAVRDTHGSASGLEVRATATGDGDRQLVLENGADRAMDVSVLFVDTHYNIHAIWPTQEGRNRIPPGESVTWGGRIDTTQTIGREQLLVLATPGQPGRVPVDFTFLATPTGATRGATQSPLQALLQRAVFDGGRTRGASPAEARDLQIEVLTWTAR